MADAALTSDALPAAWALAELELGTPITEGTLALMDREGRDIGERVNTLWRVGVHNEIRPMVAQAHRRAARLLEHGYR